MTQLDAQFMKDVTTVTSFGSTKGLNVYNLQNFISTINIEQSDVPGGLNFGVRMIDGTVGGLQVINLDHSGTANNGTFLADETTSGNDVVTDFILTSKGQNKITIDGTSVAKSFTVVDFAPTDVTTVVSADDTEAMTSIDTSFVQGTVKMFGFEAEGGNTLTITEGGGTNTFGIAVEDNATLKVNGGNGTDTLFAHFQQEDASGDGGTIIVTEGHGNDTLDVDNDNAGNFQTVTATYGNGNNNLDVESGTNAAITLKAGNGNDNVGVHVAEQGVVKVTLGNGANNVTVDNGEQSKVTVTGGNGGNNVTINTVDSDSASISPLNEVDGHQVYTVTLGTGVDHLNITPGGSDPLFTLGSVGDDATLGDDFGTLANPGDDFSPGDDTVFAGQYPNGEPDSVIASNQVITVAMGDGGTALDHQTTNIETGVNSKVTFTSGNGVEDITILADNDLWTHDPVNDTVVFAGQGGSTISVTTGNGKKNVLVNADNTGFDPVSGKFLDAGSSVKVSTGTGDDLISVILGTAGQGNSANVSAGAGNDRVQFDMDDIGANIVADGGSQTTEDIIALTSASAGKTFASLTGLSNFEALEVTNALVNNINLDAFEPANTINHVILDAGFSGGNRTISGVEQNAQIDVLAGSTGELILLVDNAALNPNDTVNLKLDANGGGGAVNFGIIDVSPLGPLTTTEFVNIHSTSHGLGSSQNNLVLEAPGIQTLTIQHDAAGDVTLNLNGSTLTGITKVDATGFTGGIIDNAPGFGNAGVTFLAAQSGNDDLVFGSGNDKVTLGNGNNTVVLGNGTNSLTAGNGNNIVTSGSGIDTITLGSGTNTVAAGGKGDAITVASHTTTDTFVYAATSDSGFTLGDIIKGFNQATDKIDFSTIDATATDWDYVEVNGAVAVIAAVAGDVAGQHTVVLDKTTGDLFVDFDGNHVLSTGAGGDMQITLVGVTHLTSANFAPAFT